MGLTTGIVPLNKDTPMIITVASGKGGTGKTTVTVNLAAVAGQGTVQVFDCDVEEPNAHLFLNPRDLTRETVTAMVPGVDMARCTLCGACEALCQFSAIALVAGKLMTFPDMCHSCRGCEMVCPEMAIQSSSRVLGHLIQGQSSQGITLTWGELRVGEAMSPPLIRQVKSRINRTGLSLVDAPPGTSCPAVASLRGSDFALLVTEPTPFGLNDLALTVGALEEMGIPMGIVINRDDPGPSVIDDYAASRGIPILQRLPFSREAAAVVSNGGLLVDELPRMRALFEELYEKLKVILEKIPSGEVVS